MLEIKLLQTSDEKSVLRKQADLESKIQFFFEDALQCRNYLAAVLDGQVVGLVGFVDNSMWFPGGIGVSFISTHEGFRNRGVASRLVVALFELANARKQPIAMTAYEVLGITYLKPIVKRVSESFPSVMLKERD